MTSTAPIEWLKRVTPADLNLDGLARLETVVLQDHPQVQASISAAVADFTPVAQEIEQRHDGRRLMAPVVARMTQDYRRSTHPLLSLMSFLIVLLPAVALGISLRGTGSVDGGAWTVAILLVSTAVMCAVKLISVLPDPVATGIMLRWILGAAMVSLITLGWMLYRASQLLTDPAATVATVASTLVLVAYAAFAVFRSVRNRRRLLADLAPVQGDIDAYTREMRPKYDHALAKITDAVATLPDAEQKRLKRSRDGVISALIGSHGLYSGQVPLFIGKRALGELQLMAVSEPLLGGGAGYPVKNRR